MFTEHDLRSIAYRMAEYGPIAARADVWKEAGAHWQRRYGRAFNCRHRRGIFRGKACWHVMHETHAMQELGRAIDDGRLDTYIGDALYERDREVWGDEIA